MLKGKGMLDGKTRPQGAWEWHWAWTFPVSSLTIHATLRSRFREKRHLKEQAGARFGTFKYSQRDVERQRRVEKPTEISSSGEKAKLQKFKRNRPKKGEITGRSILGVRPSKGVGGKQSKYVGNRSTARGKSCSMRLLTEPGKEEACGGIDILGNANVPPDQQKKRRVTRA